MLTLLLLTWLQATPPKPAAPPPAKPAPAATQPARPRASGAASTTLTITVTDSVGVVLEGVAVTLLGPVDREGKTGEDGRLRLLSVPGGTYRARFAHEGFYTFEKELAWRAGQPAPTLTVTLNQAPPAPEPPPPPPAPEPKPAEFVLPPPSSPKTMQLPDFIERNFITSREGHKESLVGCSGVAQSLVWQVRQPWTDRSHPSADAMLYVIGGEGTLTMGGRDAAVGAGSYAVVPRGTEYGLTPRGRNPLIMLATLAGAPCAVN